MLTEMPPACAVVVERTRDAQHGDFATNIALRLAKAAGRNPRELAQAIVAALPANELIARTEVAGAGFINFYLKPPRARSELARIHELGDSLRRQPARRGRARAGRVRVRQSHRSAARRVTAARPPTARRWRTSSPPPASASRASTTSMMPGGRWTSSPSAPGCAICSCVAKRCPFPRTAIAATTCGRWRRAARRCAGERLRAPGRRGAGGTAAGCPAGDKELYIDALIARGARADRRGWLSATCCELSLEDDARRHPR